MAGSTASEDQDDAVMSRDFPHPERHAQLVWFDPGETTGIVIITLRPSWLGGKGKPTWEDLGRAISNTWFAQVGTSSAVVSEGKKRKPRRGRVIKDDELGTPHTDREIETIRQCETVLIQWPRAAWGVEDFILRGMSSDRALLSPVRIISALRYGELVFGRQREPFVQSASIAKSTATDERLRMAGLYRAGLPHATDAARHATTFLRAARGDEDLRHMAWPHLFEPPEPKESQE